MPCVPLFRGPNIAPCPSKQRQQNNPTLLLFAGQPKIFTIARVRALTCCRTSGLRGLHILWIKGVTRFTIEPDLDTLRLMGSCGVIAMCTGGVLGSGLGGPSCKTIESQISSWKVSFIEERQKVEYISGTESSADLSQMCKDNCCRHAKCCHRMQPPSNMQVTEI